MSMKWGFFTNVKNSPPTAIGERNGTEVPALERRVSTLRHYTFAIRSRDAAMTKRGPNERRTDRYRGLCACGRRGMRDD
jgi:hypothetical protein